jgi:hypothetical protein
LLLGDGSALTGGELQTGGIYDIQDNGTSYILLNSAQGSGIINWTPRMTFGGNSVGVAYTAQQGQYVKINRFVYFAFYIALSSKGSSVGTAAIAGLPYTANNTILTLLGSPPVVGNFVWSYVVNPAPAPSNLIMQVVNNTTTVQIYATSTNGAQPGQAISDTEFSNSSTCRGAGIYLC